MRTVDLWHYLPPILQEFLEMGEIIRVETPEFQTLAEKLDNFSKDSFITKATVNGIKRFEGMLKIYPDSAASLETRRSAVLTKWWDVTPYTLRPLKNRIVALQGNDNVQITFSDDDPYIIQIVTRLETAGQTDDLDYILQTMIPANLIVDSFNMLEVNSDITPVYAIGATMTGSLSLTNDLDTNMTLPIEHNMAVGMTDTNTLFLTNDLNEIVDLGVTAHPAIGSGYTNIIEI